MRRVNYKKIIILIVSISLALAVICGGCAWYLSDCYRADLGAINTFSSAYGVPKSEADNIVTYGEDDSRVGFIFYPGGKVEHTSYEPLMVALASNGVFCVLTEMPFNIAVFDINAADGVCERYPEVERWYIGGHSLGGSMAASYAADNPESFEGVILLGSYSTADLSQTSLDVSSIFGSEDGVMNREKYNKYKKNLPSDLSEYEIEGGCHAYFGMYGEQKGDGYPAISAEEQIRITADCILKFVSEGDH